MHDRMFGSAIFFLSLETALCYDAIRACVKKTVRDSFRAFYDKLCLENAEGVMIGSELGNLTK